MNEKAEAEEKEKKKKKKLSRGSEPEHKSRPSFPRRDAMGLPESPPAAPAFAPGAGEKVVGGGGEGGRGSGGGGGGRARG